MRGSGSAITGRAAAFLLLWCVLAGIHTGDLPAAAVAVWAATWTSLRLLPPGEMGLSPAGLAHLALKFPRQSLLAGLDVASRALSPGLKLRTGFVTYPCALPAGAARDGFAAFIGLLPGTLGVASRSDGTMLVHCLDTEQPVAAQLAADEAAFAAALGRPERP